MCQTDTNGMANIVDIDQNAVLYFAQSFYVPILRIFYGILVSLANYSRTSVARTRMARLPQLFRTRS